MIPKSGKMDASKVDSAAKKVNAQTKFRVTIEPPLFLTMFSVMLMYLVSQNLFLEKACKVNLKIDGALCDQVVSQEEKTNETEETERLIQDETARVMAWKFFIDHGFPIFFCMVMGTWSDKHGRKPLLLASMFGYFLGSLSFLLNVYMADWRLETAVVMYGLCHGAGGASVSLGLGTISYISDISSQETKTQRVGFTTMFMLLATPFASSAGGPLVEFAGYYGAFGMAAVLILMSFIYTLVFIPESVTERHRHGDTYFRDMFDLTNILTSLRSLFKKREGRGRLKIFVLCFLIFFTLFYSGEFSIMYFYVRYAFNWDITQFGIFSTYRFVINLTGIIFTLGVVSHWLKVSDAMIGILGSASQILCSLCFAFSYKFGIWLLYVAPVVDLLNGAVVIVNKAMLAKMVPANELGQLAAVSSVVEAVVPIVANPLYTGVYDATFQTAFPGTAFMVTVVVMVICIAAFGLLYYDFLQNKRLRLQTASELKQTASKTGQTASKTGQTASEVGQTDSEVRKMASEVGQMASKRPMESPTAARGGRTVF